MSAIPFIWAWSYSFSWRSFSTSSFMALYSGSSSSISLILWAEFYSECITIFPTCFYYLLFNAATNFVILSTLVSEQSSVMWYIGIFVTPIFSFLPVLALLPVVVFDSVGFSSRVGIRFDLGLYGWRVRFLDYLPWFLPVSPVLASLLNYFLAAILSFCVLSSASKSKSSDKTTF